MSRNWLTDFKYEDGAWLVKKTGHRVPANFQLANDIFTWLTQAVTIAVPFSEKALVRRVPRSGAPTVRYLERPKTAEEVPKTLFKLLNTLSTT